MRQAALLALLVLGLTGCAGNRGKAPQPVVVRPAQTHSVSAGTPPSDLALIQPHSALFEATRQTPNSIALTFDAGADGAAVPLLLKTLAAHHSRATFFLTGKFCEKFPKECRAIADAGMELGNHSYSHPHFRKLNRASILKQLAEAETAIVKACGRGAKPLFRFPYGDCDARTQSIVAQAGYQGVGWTVDSRDSVGKTKSKAFVAARLLRRLKPGYIALMHVSQIHSAEALAPIFSRLEHDGMHQAPVSRLLLASIRETERHKALRTASLERKASRKGVTLHNLQQARDTQSGGSRRSLPLLLPSRSAHVSHSSLNRKLQKRRRLVTAGRVIYAPRSRG